MIWWSYPLRPIVKHVRGHKAPWTVQTEQFVYAYCTTEEEAEEIAQRMRDAVPVAAPILERLNVKRKSQKRSGGAIVDGPFMRTKKTKRSRQ